MNASTLTPVLGLMALLLVGKPLAQAYTGFSAFFFMAVLVYELYGPLWILRRNGEHPYAYGIHAHGLSVYIKRQLRRLTNRYWPALYARLPPIYYHEHFERASFIFDIKQVGLLTAVVFPLYGLGFFAVQSLIAKHYGFTLSVAPRLPSGLLYMLVSDLMLIAIPEELFYRGFLQRRLLRTLPVWQAILLTNVFFALGHFLGDYALYRLLPFFPGILFSILAYRSGSIMGASIFHALCNCWSAVLAVSLVWNR